MPLQGQSLSKRLNDAVKQLEADQQTKSGLVALYVANNQTGEVIYSNNGSTGLPVASSQKVITSVTALELLGKDYTYTTKIAHDGKVSNGILQGNLYVLGSGDPTTGSWRYEKTREQALLQTWSAAVKKAGINHINGVVVCPDNNFETQTVPGGWIWDDMGNYYGAGISAVNWHENQYDMHLQATTKIGGEVKILSTSPTLHEVNVISELTTGAPGSGDNAYIYLAPYAKTGFVRGTIPPGTNTFTISGSFPNPPLQLQYTLQAHLKREGITIGNTNTNFPQKTPPNLSIISTTYSPTLAELNNWFLKKSINLYGEAFVKSLSEQKTGKGETKTGLEVIKDFWALRGIHSSAINIKDGSGLSPLNRVTAETLVKVMQYARSRPWFELFYQALPDINGMKMKSGTIGGTKSFTGYSGNYTFAIIVTNYNGSTSSIVNKMYRLLNILK